VCNFERHTERVDYNIDNKEHNKFFRDKIYEVHENDPDALFYLYNGNAFGFVGGLDEIKDYFICLNDPKKMEDFNDKNFFHRTFDKNIDLLQILPGNNQDSDYRTLCTQFSKTGTKTRFIIQAPVASGGSGTYILDSENGEEIRTRLTPEKQYLRSIYQENNVSVNIHAVIFQDDIILTPGSIQIMREDDNRLMYRGADFVTYREISKENRDKFEKDSLLLCQELQKLGYRGVCGIDAIIFNGEVRLLEFNNRFQSSTGLINYAFKDNKLRSIQEINIDAFNPDYKLGPDDKRIHDIDVNYSNYTYIYNGTNEHAEHIINSQYKEKDLYKIELDGFVAKQKEYIAVSYLYRAVFKTNITWISPDGTIYIHENVCDPYKDMRDKIKFPDIRDLLALKIALMTQGVVIDESALNHLEKNGGIRPATNEAVDIKWQTNRENDEDKKYIVVNAPLRTKFVALSPFSIVLDESEKTWLEYYGEKIVEISIYPKDELSERTTSANNIPYSEIAYLSTDRLRVHHTNQCLFKREGASCQFCDLVMDENRKDIPLEDIQEVVDEYCKHYSDLELRHFLVGGQSAEDDVARDKVVKIIEILRNTAPTKKIYAMVLPYDLDAIIMMRDAGLDELAFNIELFDDKLAEKYMPGKSRIKRDDYFDALINATCCLINPEQVRSMVIVGLEPIESTINGIKKLAEAGVQPMLSVFRPLSSTKLKDVVPPPMRRLYELFHLATNICKENRLSLGPKCSYCQNNTLSLPY
jgi:hypothetical protein